MPVDSSDTLRRAIYALLVVSHTVPIFAIALLQAVGASGRQVFLKGRLPSALSSVFSGIRIAVSYSVIGAIGGEWVGASQVLVYSCFVPPTRFALTCYLRPLPSRLLSA